jgi:hypothetical protein
MKKVHRETNEFGASALTENRKRNARIVSETECHFAVMEKEAFDRSVSKIINK